MSFIYAICYDIIMMSNKDMVNSVRYVMMLKSFEIML